MRTWLLSGLIIGVVLVGLAGCGGPRITNLPPNVSEQQVQAWYAATGAAKVIAQSTKGLTESVIAVHTADPRVIANDDYQKVLLVLGKTAQAGIHVDSILRQAPNRFAQGTKQQIMATIQPVLAELSRADLEGLFSRSQSPQLQAELVVVRTLTQSLELFSILAP